MRLVLTLVGRDPSALQDALPLAVEAAVGTGRPIADTHVLGEVALDLVFDDGDAGRLRDAVGRALADTAADFCVQPVEGRRKRLLIADMDSTIITCECLDELADYAGVKAEIAAITERAMAGELDFEAALTERVGRLAGLDLGALQKTYDERVRLNPGARTLARTMAAHGARCVLVSGGFEFFTRRPDRRQFDPQPQGGAHGHLHDRRLRLLRRSDHRRPARARGGRLGPAAGPGHGPAHDRPGRPHGLDREPGAFGHAHARPAQPRRPRLTRRRAATTALTSSLRGPTRRTIQLETIRMRAALLVLTRRPMVAEA